MMRPDRYQLVLIILGFVATGLFAHFLYKEIFPEYLIYQDDYVALEEFRSQYTHEPPPVFKKEVKQIVFEREDKGPAKIDRCTSCHVAVELPDFSSTKIEYDLNGNIARDLNGTPLKVSNENYVWKKLDEKIAALTDEKVIAQLHQNGESAKAEANIKEAAALKALKTTQIGDHVYDVTKVLSMHPLIGKETRAFEFHPLSEYGCTSCHSGNGRGLTAETAHGPVFDGEYEAEYMGPKPEFTERDPLNDPKFSRVFNAKPSDALVFQTTPILVGNLIQSSCIQCHQQSKAALQGVADTAGSLAGQRLKRINAIKAGYVNDQEALLALLQLKQLIQKHGVDQTLVLLNDQENDLSRLPKERKQLVNQINFLKNGEGRDAAARQQSLLKQIDAQSDGLLGNAELVQAFEKQLITGKDSKETLNAFLKTEQNNPVATGTLFAKWRTINLENALLEHIKETQQTLEQTAGNPNVVSGMASDIDWLTLNYHRGQELYLSQACYACHRIAGLARGGVGPELTMAGKSYPWYLKESIVWPQADLPTSTMPNYVLDHQEVEDLMTFLLGQKGSAQTVSQTEYKLAIQEWEAGRKSAWEKPVPPSDIHNVRYGMKVFATEGCAACHRLEGYQSDIGFRIEKEGKPTFDALDSERQWFRGLFPEDVRGSAIVQALEEHATEIDQHIVGGVRQGSILEEIEKSHPQTVEAQYSNFRFASRAKDHESDKKVLDAWKDRVHRILMVYVQEYGLGRLVGPRPNWSGVYRSDEWLMEHFRNPTAHVPRSIMPVFPFDETKFAALTYMLDVLGKHNRDAARAVWEHKGFNPEQAYQLFCAQCHGPYMQGNGPVSVWIYPIPKNLRNSEFMRNLTREHAVQSITHGVKGTPMPPWGETPQPKPGYDGIPVLTAEEINKLVDWLYSGLPGGTVIKGMEDVPKWHYTPRDVLEELKREGSQLKDNKKPKLGLNDLVPFLSGAKVHEIYYAALEPIVQKPINHDELVEGVFDVKPNPIPGGEKYAYYIKQKFYTEENIEQGKAFFELNCSVCHGQEADGMGIRSSVMKDAKPRMLTNLDWLKTRDDLRLLRSIKYGVPGTAMTPWGDMTSSLQRLQLVMFIRSLSHEKDRRDALAEALYNAFDTIQSVIEQARIQSYPALKTLENEYDQVKRDRKNKFAKTSLDDAVSLYKQEFELTAKLEKLRQIDQLLIDLNTLIGKQREIFQAIGNELISIEVNEKDWERFLNILELNAVRFVFNNEKLELHENKKQEAESTQLVEAIVKSIDEKVSVYEQENSDQAKDEVIALTKTKSLLLSKMTENALVRAQEKQIYQKFSDEKSLR